MLGLIPARVLAGATISLAMYAANCAVAPAAQYGAAKSGTQLLYATTLDWNSGTGAVYVYHAYAKNPSPIRTIAFNAGFPDAVWTDASGHVFVGVVNTGVNGHGYINEYAPGGTTLLQTYTSGLNGPGGGTFDASGTMYVANLCTPNQAYSCSVFARAGSGLDVRRSPGAPTLAGFIGVYPPGSLQPSTQMQAPALNIPVGVAVDRVGNIFAANNTGEANWNVVKFPARSGQPKVAPLRGLPNNAWVGSVAFDQSDALVVGTGAAVDFYPNERGNPAARLTSGVLAPDGLAFGADGTLFAGNYEFENNEGNIIAFPPGATVPARSYAVPYNSGVVSIAIGAAR